MEKKMSRREFLKTSAATGAVLSMGAMLSATPGASSAEEVKTIQLAAPAPGNGSPLMQVLWKRKSTKGFGPKPVPVEVLGNLLWAANGINRPDGRRTAPSGGDWQNIDICVILKDGTYLYEPQNSRLKLITAEDLRSLAGVQGYVKDAPVNLAYVSDFSKMKDKYLQLLVNMNPQFSIEELKVIVSGAHTGLIAQNVYLYCASEGLATVVRQSFPPSLSKAMKLRSDQKIILVQSVGYSK